jgi:predicted enzyme related to lactoylglutathione lyase
MVADPQGAQLYVMSPTGGHSQATSYAPRTPGHGGWHELQTTDCEAALAFYAAQFGWKKTAAMDMGPMGSYILFNAGAGEDIGGMMNNPSLPRPLWLYYFNVADIDEASRVVVAHGGQIMAEANQVPTGDWIIRARDPQGAMFALLGPRK